MSRPSVPPVHLVAILLAAGMTVGCARRMPPRATAADADRTSISLSELEEGRSLVVSRCGARCHKPPLPSDHVAADWPKALAEMAPRANLDARERHLIQQYMIALGPP